MPLYHWVHFYQNILCHDNLWVGFVEAESDKQALIQVFDKLFEDLIFLLVEFQEKDLIKKYFKIWDIQRIDGFDFLNSKDESVEGEDFVFADEDKEELDALKHTFMSVLLRGGHFLKIKGKDVGFLLVTSHATTLTL